jgi:SAM-dependent methyltransferase
MVDRGNGLRGGGLQPPRQFKIAGNRGRPLTRRTPDHSTEHSMADGTVFFPNRFQRASQYYLNGRPTYPPLLAKRVSALIGLTRNHRVLDLGTGPGFLAVDFAPYAAEVTAIDPSPEMLSIARDNVARADGKITLVQGSSFDLDPRLGPFRLVTIGRAFHWMDRAATLQRLDEIVEPQGAVTLFLERYPDVPANLWHKDFQSIVDKYSVDDPAKPLTRAAVGHTTILLASAFSQLEKIAVIEPRATPVERFVDRALSLASTWEGSPGSRTEDLAIELRHALEKYATDGVINEVIEGEALIARRT